MTLSNRLRAWLWEHSREHSRINMLNGKDLLKYADFYFYVVKHGQPAEKLLAAEKLLPFKPVRKDIIQAVLEDPDEGLRIAAVKQMKYPEERDAILAMAKGEPSEEMMKAVINRIPWPEGKEDLIALAQGNRYPVLALRRLEGRSLLEDFALHAQHDEVRFAALDALDNSLSRSVIEQFAMEEKNDAHRPEAVRKLSYPESRDTLLKIARLGPKKRGVDTAVWMLPWAEEEGVIRELALTSMAAKKKMIKAGLCPICGAKIDCDFDSVRLGDDIEDGFTETYTYSCRQCGWQISWREDIDDPWDYTPSLDECPRK